MADCCERYMAGVDPERLLTEADQEIERLEETHQNSLKQADADCQKLKAERDEARAQLREEQDENHRISLAADEIRKDNDRLRALLREVEWRAGGPHEGGFCPVCDVYEDDGHTTDCRLAAALEGRDA